MILVLMVAVTATVAVPALQDPTVHLVGAGDIAACGSAGSARTADLLAQSGGRVFTLGDNAYPDGAPADFACFDQSWGRFKDGMLPTIGNHEYITPDATGYFDYFGASAGTDGYYAVQLGTWRLYVLNSECAHVSCDADSPQVQWLVSDLAAHPTACILAMWHEPRFSDGPHGDQTAVQPFWDALYAAGAELILNGHDHLYERFAALDPSGSPDPDHGITEIVSGTGGIGEVELMGQSPTRVTGNDTTDGVLELWLHENSVSWRFDPVPPATFTDSGSAPCHGAPSSGG
jgi:acid phosphatase type 7